MSKKTKIIIGVVVGVVVISIVTAIIYAITSEGSACTTKEDLKGTRQQGVCVPFPFEILDKGKACVYTFEGGLTEEGRIVNGKCVRLTCIKRIGSAGC